VEGSADALILMYYSVVFLDELRKTRRKLKIVGVQPEIRTEHLQNTNQKIYFFKPNDCNVEVVVQQVIVVVVVVVVGYLTTLSAS
jgi:hypothetical protein